MEIYEAVESLDALAHETRLDVYRLLVRAGPMGLPAGVIAEKTGALQNTLSSHLGKLSRAGLVTSRRSGRQVIYTANFDALGSLVKYLVTDCCKGDARVLGPVAGPARCQ